MNLLTPTPQSPLAAAFPEFARRTFDRVKHVGTFALVQALVQVLGFMSGIILVRHLDQREYAYFTIANTMQGTLNLLADIGISIGLVSIGGRVWQDRSRFSQLISTASRLRYALGGVVAVIVTPILYLMLTKNGASIGYTMLLIGVILAGVALQLSTGVLTVVPRLRSDIRKIQVIDFTGTIVRLAAMIALMFIFLNAGVGVALGTATFLLQYLMLRAYCSRVIDFHAPTNADDRRSMLGFIRNQAANAVFYCFQGQITIFLISFFAHRTSSVAEVGALGRLAMIFAVLTNLMANVFAPAFARCHDRRRLFRMYFAVIGGVAAFSLIIIAVAALFPKEFLYVLGPKYAHLHRELLLMVGGAVLATLTGTFWSLNAAKAWIAGSWLYIPLTIATQLALIPFTDFGSVKGVLVFNLVSALPNLLLNTILSFRGFHSMKTAPA